MDSVDIDRVARMVSGLATRRSALGFVSALGLSGLVGITDDAEAKKKKKKKKKNKQPQKPPPDDGCDARATTTAELLAALDVAIRNFGPELHRICLAAGNYVLPVPTTESHDITVRKASLIGAGATQTILQGSGSGFSGLITTSRSAMRDLTVTGGLTGTGGGIVVDGPSVSLTNVIVRDNEASIGGGIFISDVGELTLDGCTITENRAANQVDSGYGGGVLNRGTLVRTNSTISGNTADQAGSENCFDQGGTGC